MKPKSPEDLVRIVNGQLTAALSLLRDSNPLKRARCSDLLDIKSRAEEVLRRADSLLFDYMSNRMLSAEHDLKHLNEKIAHGCTDAYCPICDGEPHEH